METIELIRKLPASTQQDDACVVGAFIYNVDPKHGSQSGVGPERAMHVIGTYAEVWMGHVAYRIHV